MFNIAGALHYKISRSAANTNNGIVTSDATVVKAYSSEAYREFLWKRRAKAVPVAATGQAEATSMVQPTIGSTGISASTMSRSAGIRSSLEAEMR